MFKVLTLLFALLLGPAQDAPHHDFSDDRVASISGEVFSPSQSVENTTNVTLSIQLEPNTENFWLISVVTRKSDGWEMRHFGPIDPAFYSIPDLWPNLGDDTYEAYVILERVKRNSDGDVTEVDDYTSKMVTFTLGKN